MWIFPSKAIQYISSLEEEFMYTMKNCVGFCGRNIVLTMRCGFICPWHRRWPYLSLDGVPMWALERGGGHRQGPCRLPRRFRARWDIAYNSRSSFSFCVITLSTMFRNTKHMLWVPKMKEQKKVIVGRNCGVEEPHSKD